MGRIDACEHALRLAERVSIEHAGAAGGGVLPPPTLNSGHDFRLRAPVVDRQAEGRFGDEDMRPNRLERGDDAVGLELVVAGHDPYFSVPRHPHLRRAEHVAGRVERDLDAVPGQDLAIGRRLDHDLAEPPAKDRGGERMADVDIRPEARVVGVAMGNHRARDGPPRVDMKIAGLAIEAAVGRSDQVHHARRKEREQPGEAYRRWPTDRQFSTAGERLTRVYQPPTLSRPLLAPASGPAPAPARTRSCRHRRASGRVLPRLAPRPQSPSREGRL